MSRKVVGITCSSSSDGDNARQCLNTAYVLAVLHAGGTPVIIPNIVDESLVDAYLESIDGLLLSGGVDVDPAYYGEMHHPQLGEVDAARDRTEIRLIKRAVEMEKPILGICRGIQVLNVALGGSLYQHLPDQAPSDISHRQSDQQIPRSQFSHTIEVDPTCRLHSILETTEMPTNSFHHQALKRIAPGLAVTARAADGVVEGVERPDYRFMVGVQFHPEETAPVDELSRRLFETFVKAL